MSMTKLLCGVAALPLIAGAALAAPVKQPAPVKHPSQLSDRQMDKVTAGIDFAEFDFSDDQATLVSLHEKSPNSGMAVVTSTASPPAFLIGYNINVSTAGTVSAGPYNNSITCSACFINVSNPSLSVASAFR